MGEQAPRTVAPTHAALAPNGSVSSFTTDGVADICFGHPKSNSLPSTILSALAEAIDAALPQPFERTAVNGFGFVQIVRPRLRASLVELAQDRAVFEARALLRRAALEPPGPKRLVAHPAVIAIFESRQAWVEALSRQVGGSVGLRADAALPISGAYAESA